MRPRSPPARCILADRPVDRHARVRDAAAGGRGGTRILRGRPQSGPAVTSSRRADGGAAAPPRLRRGNRPTVSRSFDAGVGAAARAPGDRVTRTPALRPAARAPPTPHPSVRVPAVGGLSPPVSDRVTGPLPALDVTRPPTSCGESGSLKGAACTVSMACRSRGTPEPSARLMSVCMETLAVALPELVVPVLTAGGPIALVLVVLRFGPDAFLRLLPPGRWRS